MKIDIKTKEEAWYDFDEDTKFQIIPFNFSEANFSEVNLKDDMSGLLKGRFMYCLINWKGLTGVKGEIFKYTEYNKELLYNYYNSIRDFVLIKSDIENDKKED